MRVCLPLASRGELSLIPARVLLQPLTVPEPLGLFVSVRLHRAHNLPYAHGLADVTGLPVRTPLAAF